MDNPDLLTIIPLLLKNQPKTLEELDSFKRSLSKKLKIPVLSNVTLLEAYRALCARKRITPNKSLEILLRKRLVRSLSGIAVVSVLTKPYPCPGKCLYCPTEKGMPKSYLSNEPAAMRAVLNQFDPIKQVKNRLKSLALQGHPTDKVELIIIGGTWSCFPKRYQEWFIQKCFEAANSKASKTLEAAQKLNEKAKHRIIGITIETRPDYITQKEIAELRRLGVTRVEMGVQSIYDDVLKFNLRGHLVEATIKATKLLKDAGFKVCYHVMPNLPKSDLKKDEEMFKELFSNPDFQPDLLKIYPCAILKEAPLYELWEKGGYKPYTERQLITLLLKVKKCIPYYCRIQRLIRDLPATRIIEGPAKISSMRQVLEKELKEQNIRCKCIRCREVGEKYDPKEELFLFRQDYDAAGGKEIFLSYENKARTSLYSLLRLRIPAKPFLPVLKDSSIIRELHTYGQLQPLKEKEISPQHKGLGKKLIKEAERITKEEFKLKKIAVISGVGVRGYYRKQGYKLKDTYMIKSRI